MSAGTLDLQPVVDDIRARIVTIWPEVALNGVWDAEHINQIPWVDLEMPYAVILIEDLPISEYAIDRLTFEPEISVYYVSAELGKANDLRDKLHEFANGIWPDDSALTRCQVMDVTDISWADTLHPNAVFRFANHLARAGRVSFDILMQ